jgi:predicted ATPase
VAKSLVSVSFEGPAANYRLSESTRAYAMEKLQAEGEVQDITLRHARYLSLSFQTRASADRENERGNPPDFQQTLDDARAAQAARALDQLPAGSVDAASERRVRGPVSRPTESARAPGVTA